MPYTYKSLALVWLIVLALVAVSGSGVAEGPWVVLVIVAALVAPWVLTAYSDPPSPDGTVTTASGGESTMPDDPLNVLPDRRTVAPRP